MDATDALLATAATAIAHAEALLSSARLAVWARVAPAGDVEPGLLQAEQRATHGLAWYATEIESLRQMQGWARRLDEAGRLHERERLLFTAAMGDGLARLAHGVAMGPHETARAEDLGLDESVQAAFLAPPVRRLIHLGGAVELRRRLASLIEDGAMGDIGLADETLDIIREQFRRFADRRVAPFAQGWHLADDLIPLPLIEELGRQGVFGLTVAEADGGLGMGREAMCLVTEELARASLAVGSLATRSEIAAELLALAGTPEQKRHHLAGIARGAILPTAAFTEPEAGSDLGAVATRAERDGDVFRLHGSKTWITHAARADLMIVLCRTEPGSRDHRGLSLLLAPKPRGTDADPFPVEGLSGAEIPVLGYRGMKEYALAFDGFAVPAGNLLGGRPGQGFRQLMATFETARIQTAARAIGVAEAAFREALAYARTRRQFGQPLFAFPRVRDKLVAIAVDLMRARQLTYHAAREKDAGRRVDLLAGMAKLLAARVAWAAADDGVQIHGGSGYALGSRACRLLADARILSIFEGTAEIQAQIIARRLLAA
jgi:(2S)-methylsuccinyl-CoA dehydrogenase